MVVDCFSMVAHFILCHKTDNALHIADLYFRKVLCLHRVPRRIVFYWDTEFLNFFLKIVLALGATFKPTVKLRWSTKLWRPFLGQLFQRTRRIGKLNLHKWCLHLIELQAISRKCLHSRSCELLPLPQKEVTSRDAEQRVRDMEAQTEDDKKRSSNQTI